MTNKDRRQYIAAVDTSFMTAHTLDAGTRSNDGSRWTSEPWHVSSYGRDFDRIERRHGHWRLAHRGCVFEANRLHIGKAPTVNPQWIQSKRSNEDSIFRRRRELGMSDTPTRS